MSPVDNIRFSSVPEPLATQALHRPVTRHLVVDHVGLSVGEYVINRPQGANSTIVQLSVAGEGWARIDGTVHRVPVGTALLLPAGLPHDYGSGDEPWVFWWCMIRGQEASDLVRTAGFRRERPVVAIRNVERIVALFEDMVSSYERDHSPARLLQVTGTAWKLLTEIAVDRVLPARGDALQRAMDYLAARLDRDVPVSELASLVGLSSSRLSSLFRVSTGGGVHAYHVDLRMATARRLLDTTAEPVGVVARRVGYSDQRYFSRHFGRVHGMSPTEFRHRVRP